MDFQRGEQKTFAVWAVVLLILEYLTMITIFSIEVASDFYRFQVSGTLALPNTITTFRMGGYCKALITFVKYCPQVYLNWRRKSTVGWSIANILLDFTGGMGSILQQVFEFADLCGKNGSCDFFNPGGSSDAFNVVKFMLGVIAVFFDLIFITQHFILYRHNRHDPALELVRVEEQLEETVKKRNSADLQGKTVDEPLLQGYANDEGRKTKQEMLL